MADARVCVLLPAAVPAAIAWLPAIARLRAAGRTPVLVGPAWAGDLFAGLELAFRDCADGLRRGLLGHEAACGATWRAGLAARWAGVPGWGPGWPWRHRVADGRPWAIAGALLGAGPDAEPPPSLRLADHHRREADQALAQAGVRGAFTVLGPLATPPRRRRSTSWPGFPLLARLLREAGRQVVLLPGGGDADRIAALCPDAACLIGLGAGATAGVLARATSIASDDPALTWPGAAIGAAVVAVGVGHPPGCPDLGPARWPNAAAVWHALRRTAGPASPSPLSGSSADGHLPISHG